MKTCHCGALYSHPTSHECSFCAGRVCPAKDCGRAKPVEAASCGRKKCEQEMRRKATAASAGDAVTAKVLTITRKAV